MKFQYKELYAVALSKILVLKRKNRRLNQEMKDLQKKYDDLQQELSSLESKYESACDELSMGP